MGIIFGKEISMGHNYVKEEETFNITRNGTVPKPIAADILAGHVLKADGTWGEGGGGGTVTDVQVDGQSVVDEDGVAQIPAIPQVPVQDVEVNGQSVVDADGVAEIPAIPDDLNDLSDVSVSSPTNGQVLKYNSTTRKFENANESGGGGGGNVDDVQVNGTSVVDANKVAKIISYKEVTQSEYNALPASKESDGVLYCISDAPGGIDGFPPLIYSDEEREVGVWRNGKPLYQKTLYIGALTNDTDWHSVQHGISNLGDVISIDGSFKDANGYSLPLNIYRANSQMGISLRVTSTLFEYINNWVSGAVNAYATIKYTKITDVAGSGKWSTDGSYTHHYSTTEKVIGTWTDGKPLYEKTIIKSGSLTAGDWNTASSGVSDIETMVDLRGGCSRTWSGAEIWIYYPFSFYEDGSINGCVRFVFGSGVDDIHFRPNPSGNSFKDAIFILQYTKTTD